MDPASENKRPRLSTGSTSWSAGATHTLPYPTPSSSAPLHPPASSPYQPHPPHYPPRSSESLPPPSHHPPQQQPPPPPQQQQQQQQQPSHPPPPAPPPQHHLHHPEDRRQHEQEPYNAPMQDPYRPPPSPAHPPHYASYPPPRDPTGIKREPEDSQPRRPHSTGSGQPEGLPSHPVPPPGPQPYPDDPRRHMSFDNGQSMPPTPGGYRHPSYPPPPTPISQGAPYDHGYPPPPQTSSGPPAHELYNINFASTAKRKATRASQACESCRQLKAKCDELKPCKSCKEKGLDCKYRDPVPKAADKTQADILDGISELKNMFRQQTRASEQRIRNLEKALGHLRPELKFESLPHDSMEDTKHFISSTPAADSMETPDDGAHEPYQTPMQPGQSPQPLMGQDESHMPQPMFIDDDRDDDEGLRDPPGPAVRPGKPSMPVNHTTPAGFLLTWPSIRTLTGHLLQQEKVEYIEEFPLLQEQDRGLLRLFGRGEGNSPSDPPTEHGTLDMEPELSSDVGQSPSSQADWGTLGGLSPAAQGQPGYKSAVLTAEGQPDFSEAKVKLYVKSFEDNILNMHPILTPKEVSRLVRRFLDNLTQREQTRLAPQQSGPVPVVAKFVAGQVQAQSPNEVTGKRKRSPTADSVDQPLPVYPPRPAKPFRTVDNALMLVILALGKICLHRDKIPDVPRDSVDPQQHGSPLTRNGHPASPGQTSPPAYSAHSHSSGLPSPKEYSAGSSSRRQSVQSSSQKSGHSIKRNFDIIPGLEYFAYATDILGNQLAGTRLTHVHAYIFAGLYYGQLGRVMESYRSIHSACTTLQIIMRTQLDRLQKHVPTEPIVKKRDNQLLLSYWTCLQLESDILAELNLPQSGILAYEENMPYPTLHLIEGMDSRVAASYLAQLFLRKRLNYIHSKVYNPHPELSQPPDEKPLTMFDIVLEYEDLMRGFMQAQTEFAFREDDFPADDILAARFRAKYWGAQVITYRPFVKRLLDFSHSLQHGIALGPEGSSGPLLEPQIPSSVKSHGDIDAKLVEFARKGIRALVESTQAFHGVDSSRIIITNVFGTAHAQWGNLLVLAAAFRDPLLGQFIDEDKLRHLFRRTITFFSKITQPSSALLIDMRILEGVEREFFLSGVDPRANSSFSSVTSMPAPSAQTPTILPGMPPPMSHPIHSPHQSLPPPPVRLG